MTNQAITVSITEAVKRSPDQAIVHVETSGNGETPALALEAVEDRTKSFENAVSKLELEVYEKTTDMKQPFSEDESENGMYKCEKTYETNCDIDELDSLFQTVYDVEIEIDQIEFYVCETSRSEMYKEAIVEGKQNARQDAEIIAKKEGSKLGELHHAEVSDKSTNTDSQWVSSKDVIKDIHYDSKSPNLIHEAETSVSLETGETEIITVSPEPIELTVDLEVSFSIA